VSIALISIQISRSGILLIENMPDEEIAEYSGPSAHTASAATISWPSKEGRDGDVSEEGRSGMREGASVVDDVGRSFDRLKSTCTALPCSASSSSSSSPWLAASRASA